MNELFTINKTTKTHKWIFFLFNHFFLIGLFPTYIMFSRLPRVLYTSYPFISRMIPFCFPNVSSWLFVSSRTFRLKNYYGYVYQCIEQWGRWGHCDWSDLYYSVLSLSDLSVPRTLIRPLIPFSFYYCYISLTLTMILKDTLSRNQVGPIFLGSSTVIVLYYSFTFNTNKSTRVKWYNKELNRL